MAHWTDQFKRQQEQEADAKRITAEAEVYRNRKFQSLAADWWEAVTAHIKGDAGKLGFTR
jgi:hypothetical protein